MKNKQAFPGKKLDDPGSSYRPSSYKIFSGMTLRDYYAGLAMQGIMANPAYEELSDKEVAKIAIRYADTLLEKL